MRLPEGMPARELPTSILAASNLQGINRKGDEMDHSKWVQLTQVIKTINIGVRAHPESALPWARNQLFIPFNVEGCAVWPTSEVPGKWKSHWNDRETIFMQQVYQRLLCRINNHSLPVE